MDDDSIFDAASYKLPVPEMDGRKADKIALGFTGGIELDRTREEDLELVRELELLGYVEIRVRARVLVKQYVGREMSDGEEVAYKLNLRVVDRVAE